MELKEQVEVEAELLTKSEETLEEDRTVEKTTSSTGIRRKMNKKRKLKQQTWMPTQKMQAQTRNRSNREMSDSSLTTI